MHIAVSIVDDQSIIYLASLLHFDLIAYKYTALQEHPTLSLWFCFDDLFFIWFYLRLNLPIWRCYVNAMSMLICPSLALMKFTPRTLPINGLYCWIWPESNTTKIMRIQQWTMTPTASTQPALILLQDNRKLQMPTTFPLSLFDDWQMKFLSTLVYDMLCLMRDTHGHKPGSKFLPFMHDLWHFGPLRSVPFTCTIIGCTLHHEAYCACRTFWLSSLSDILALWWVKPICMC